LKQEQVEQMEQPEEEAQMAEMDKNKPLTTGEVADFCHVTHRAVLKWVESGKLRAYRTPGNHSRVSIEDFVSFLQQYKMPIPAQLQAPVDTSALPKILIVDDDRGMVNSLDRTLRMENKYAIEVAYDGFEAGKKFASFKPEFIILDLRMPGLDGYQVCANIRRDPNNRHVKILAISGESEAHEIKKIMDLGADGYLQKPFNNKELKEKISQMWK
jgi:two-component system, OmpR family, response regulator VicR